MHLLKEFSGKRETGVFEMKRGRMAGRFCTVVSVPAVKGKNGNMLSTKRFYGCVKSKAEAIDRAEQLAKAASLPKSKSKSKSKKRRGAQHGKN